MSMGGAGRPMPHSGRPGQGGVGGGLGAGGPGGGGGGGQGRSAAYGGAARGPPGGGGNGLLQPPMHTRHVPTSAHDNGAYRPQMRFRPSDKKSSGAAPGGAIKPRSRMPLLDPRHIQALTAPVEKQNAYHREPEEEVEGDKEKKGGGTNSGRTLSGFIRESSSSTGGVGIGKKEEGAGKGGERAGGMGKKANKREAAEMLGPDATDQLAAATAKVRVSDVAEEDGEGKRANKREAAEMLGPDATDQLAAATARVRVSDEVEDEVEGAEIKSGAAVTASAFSAVSSPAVAAVISGGISSGISSPGSKVDGAGEDEGEEQSKRKASPSRALEGEKGGKRAGKRSTRGGGRGATDLDVVAGKVDGEASVGGGCGNEAKGANGLLEEGSAGGAAELVEKQGVKPQETVDRDVVPKDGKELSVTAKVEGGDEGDTDGSGGASKEKGGEGSNTESEAQEDRQGVDNPKTKRGSEADAKSDGRRGDEEVGDVEDEKVAEGEAEVGDGAEGEAKVKSPVEEDEDEDDGVGETEAETVDVGAWAAAAPATRSPILMVLHVDTQEVSAGALCQLFGLYGDVIKVKLVSSRGMALVQMKYAVQAVNAQRLLDQTPLCGMLLEVKASSQWTINDPTATDFSQYQGIHRYDMAPSPEDSRYRDCLSPPCATLVVDNVSPDVSAEDLTAIFVKHGAVSSVDLDTHAEAPLDAVPTLTGTGGNTSEPKPSVQALVHMEANGRIGATEAAVHALVMTHNLTLRERRLRVSFLSGERHVGK